MPYSKTLSQEKVTKPMDLKMLSATERRMMQIIWRRNRCCRKSIMQLLPEPKPTHCSADKSLRKMKRLGYITFQYSDWKCEYLPLVERQPLVSAYLRDIMAKAFNFTPEFLEECLSGRHLQQPINHQ